MLKGCTQLTPVSPVWKVIGLSSPLICNVLASWFANCARPLRLISCVGRRGVKMKSSNGFGPGISDTAPHSPTHVRKCKLLPVYASPPRASVGFLFAVVLVGQVRAQAMFWFTVSVPVVAVPLTVIVVGSRPVGAPNPHAS